MVKIENLNTKAKQEILRKVANYFNDAAWTDDVEEVDVTFEVLVKYFLEPLSNEDYFGTEGWEKFFDI